jgi:hypothetical protein
MNKPYELVLGDRGGLFHQEQHETFEQLVEAVRLNTAKYPTKVVCFSNIANHDYDCDGLTDEERETLEDAEADGRNDAKAAK